MHFFLISIVSELKCYIIMARYIHIQSTSSL